jgi:predicted transcriptional regulator
MEDAMNTVTAVLDADTCNRLEQLAKSTARSRSWLVADAVGRYLDEESRQIAAINEGIRQADAGHFADDATVKAAFEKWNINAG